MKVDRRALKQSNNMGRVAGLLVSLMTMLIASPELALAKSGKTVAARTAPAKSAPAKSAPAKSSSSKSSSSAKSGKTVAARTAPAAKSGKTVAARTKPSSNTSTSTSTGKSGKTIAARNNPPARNTSNTSAKSGRTIDARTPNTGAKSGRTIDARTPNTGAKSGRTIDARTPNTGAKSGRTIDARTPNTGAKSGRTIAARHEREVRDTWLRQRLDNTRQRIQHLEDDAYFRGRIDQYRADYRHSYFDVCSARQRDYQNYHHDYYRLYHGYYRHGFHGGFFYPLHPVVDVTVHFGNPHWSWFYLDVVDYEQYRAYEPRYVQTDMRVFKYRRKFSPTKELEEIVLGMSDLSYETQLNFRDAVERFGDELGEKLANITRSTVVLDDNDIVINNRQFIGEDAVVVQGYVEHRGTKFGFKGFLDLRDPRSTDVFVPENEDEPTDRELDLLDRMNNRILDLGGTVSHRELSDLDADGIENN